jgi:hemerythrin superfamily protein
MNATTMLKQDHAAVKDLFRRYRSEDPTPATVELVFVNLQEHTKVEEEVFYPAVAELGGETARLVDESRADHDRVERLIDELKRELGSHPDMSRGGTFDARFQQLMEAVERHVEKEEGRMFPEAERRLGDAVDLERKMEACKHALDASGVPAT